MHISLKAVTAAFLISFANVPLAAQQQMPAPPIEYYGDLPSIEDAVISPSGEYTAMLFTDAGERAVIVYNRGNEPVKRLDVGDAKVRGIEWVGDEAILILRTETGRLPSNYTQDKTEWWRANVIPLDDRRDVISVFANQRTIVNAVQGFFGVRKVDGRWVGFFGGFRRGNTSGIRDTLLDTAPAIYAVDLLTGDAEIVDYPTDYPNYRDWLIDEEGKVGARIEINLKSGSWRIENGDRKTITTGEQVEGRVNMLGFDDAGTSVIYSEFDEAEGRNRRYAVPLAGGDKREVFDEYGIDRFVFQPYTGRILGTQLIDGSINLVDEEKAKYLSQALEGLSFASHAVVTDWTPDFRAMLANTSGNYDSGTWFRIDGESGTRSILGLERPAIQGQVIGKVSTVTYQAGDGLELEGILTLPPGKEPTNLPVVIFPHGGPTAHDVEAFDWWAQALASRGYAVFQPNFRGSTGRGMALIEAGDGEWGRKMQTDKSDGLAALAERGIVDPDRACIMGSSYGGYAALAGVTLQEGIYRCAVSVNGVSDLKPLLRWEMNGPRDTFRRATERQFGRETDLDAISPARNARNANAPVLLIHGRDDSVVPFAQSLTMEDALEDARKPVELLVLEGEDHFLSQAETRKQMLEATIAFIERHNPPD